MQYVFFVGEILLATLVLIFGYNFLNKYLFKKLKINKWLVLAIGILFLAIPYLLPLWGINSLNNSFYSYIISIVAAMFILWFFELMGWTRKAVNNKNVNKNDITIKPKAKPNRIKNNKK